jgi:hypothetical protein
MQCRFGKGVDVCTVNAEGTENGYMVNTFSVPDAVISPHGDHALYTCPAGTSDGAYAQCDGGLCFTGTEGKSFPGFGAPLSPGQIVCSCPITVANSAAAKLGFQIAGPNPCQKSFFRYCNRSSANKQTGSTIYAGAPTGTARFLTQRLNSYVPPLDQCPSPRAAE